MTEQETTQTVEQPVAAPAADAAPPVAAAPAAPEAAPAVEAAAPVAAAPVAAAPVAAAPVAAAPEAAGPEVVAPTAAPVTDKKAAAAKKKADAAKKKAEKKAAADAKKQAAADKKAADEAAAAIPIVVTGKALDVWTDAAATFVPALRADMSPEERRQAVRDVAIKATTMDDRLNLVLGELLYEAAENGYYKEWINQETGKNFTTFEEYVEGELNIKKSKAHYLKKIYRVFVVDLDLPTDILRDIEWSKAKELTEVVTKDNAAELLAKCRTMTVKQVKEMVSQLLGKPSPSPSSVTAPDDTNIRMPFVLAPEQAENVKAALKVAESMTGSDKSGNNLDLICTDFLAGAGGGGLAGVMASLDRNVQSLERAYGIKLEVAGHDQERYDALKAAEAAAAPAAPVATS